MLQFIVITGGELEWDGRTSKLCFECRFCRSRKYQWRFHPWFFTNLVECISGALWQKLLTIKKVSCCVANKDSIVGTTVLCLWSDVLAQRMNWTASKGGRRVCFQSLGAVKHSVLPDQTPCCIRDPICFLFYLTSLILLMCSAETANTLWTRATKPFADSLWRGGAIFIEC